ncbi:hypothetical protein Aperf_G00000037514 [Anoplocephala perfoliata]
MPGRKARGKKGQFTTKVVLINQDKAEKDPSFSPEDVKRYLTTKKSLKKKKPILARFFEREVEFSEGIVVGNKEKNILAYDQIRKISLLSPDGRMVFVHYGTPKSDYFLVLEMEDANGLEKFISIVRKAIPDEEDSWSEATSSDLTYALKSSYISAVPHVGDRTAHSRGTSRRALSKPHKHSRRRDSYIYSDLSDEDDDQWSGSPTAPYYYDRSNDEEISVTGIEYNRKSSHHPKSKVLPPSMTKKKPGNWHCSIEFVTPTKDGGVKSTPDGPILLYTATRVNGNGDYDSTDDSRAFVEESDFYSSSGSTPTFEEVEGYEMNYRFHE